MELGGEDRREAGFSDAPIDYDRVADVYDLYVTSELDISFYVEEATKARGKVLELMCGTGRVSVPLLEAGVDLTCVDVSTGMLPRIAHLPSCICMPHHYSRSWQMEHQQKA